MSVVDVAMVGRLGAAALAATGMGAMLFWGALSLVIGIRTGVQTVASRRLDRKNMINVAPPSTTGFSWQQLMVFRCPSLGGGWRRISSRFSLMT